MPNSTLNLHVTELFSGMLKLLGKYEDSESSVNKSLYRNCSVNCSCFVWIIRDLQKR